MAHPAGGPLLIGNLFNLDHTVFLTVPKRRIHGHMSCPDPRPQHPNHDSPTAQGDAGWLGPLPRYHAIASPGPTASQAAQNAVHPREAARGLAARSLTTG